MASDPNHDTQPSLALSRRSLPVVPPPGRVPVWPIVAFWAGAAALFAVGGVLNAVRFADILLHARGDWPSLTVFETAWLATSILFVVCAVVSLVLALLLAGRFASGVYGSLLFGLLLTLLVPLSALLSPEPDYPAAVCGGLLPATIVLFTLANLAHLVAD